MTKPRSEVAIAQGAAATTPKKKSTVELTPEEQALAAKLTIESGGRMVNKGLSHSLKLTRFIEGDFKVPARLINKADLEKVCTRIEEGAGYSAEGRIRAGLSVMTKQKVKDQVAKTIKDLTQFPLNEEQKEALAKATPKYEAFLNKYIESEGVAILKKMFLGE